MLSGAEIVRTDRVLTDIFGNILRSVYRKLMSNDRWNDWHYTRLRRELEYICDDKIKQHCKLIEKAVLNKPAIFKAMDDLSKLKKTTRQEIATELKSARKQLTKLKKEISFLGNKKISLEGFADQSYVCLYPSLPAPIVLADIDGAGVPNISGVYFVWDNGVIAYVGQSINLAARLHLGQHHQIKDGDWISWVAIDKYELDWAESFFIGSLRPVRNFGRSASYVKYKKSNDQG